MKFKLLKNIQRISTFWGIAAGTAGLIMDDVLLVIVGGVLMGIGISGWDD